MFSNSTRPLSTLIMSWLAWLFGGVIAVSKEQQFAMDFPMRWHERATFNPEKQRTWQVMAQRWNQEQKQKLDWYAWYTKDTIKIDDWAAWKTQHPNAIATLNQAVEKWSKELDKLTLVQCFRILQSCYDVGATAALAKFWGLVSKKKQFQTLDSVLFCLFLFAAAAVCCCCCCMHFVAIVYSIFFLLAAFFVVGECGSVAASVLDGRAIVYSQCFRIDFGVFKCLGMSLCGNMSKRKSYGRRRR